MDAGPAGFKIVRADWDFYRLAICVGRRRLSAMARCRLVLTVSTTRLNVSLPKLRRSALLPKGMSMQVCLTHHGCLQTPSAKYIEGLENRLNRMEHLLRLSGKPPLKPL